MRSLDLSYFAEKFDQIMDKLSRLEFEMDGKILEKASSVFPNWPPVLSPGAMLKMKVCKE